jgi:hypothetical protein
MVLMRTKREMEVDNKKKSVFFMMSMRYRDPYDHQERKGSV